MNRITKINFTGLAMTAAVVLGSSLLASGCGNGPAKPAAQASTTKPAPGFVQPTPSVTGSVNGALATDPLNQTQVAALLGNFGGNIIYTDNNGDDQTQAYRLTLSKVTQNGASFIQAAFTSSALNFTQVLSTIASPSSPPNPAGTTFLLTTTQFSAPNFYSYGNIMVQLQLTVTSANQFDPASAVVLMVDPSSTSAGGFFDKVADFSDFGRR